jgi:NADPH:quinone reductase-like Zn-dependent oxidoreductase
MILGFDAAGVVERLGPDVTGLSEGEECTGISPNR